MKGSREEGGREKNVPERVSFRDVDLLSATELADVGSVPFHTCQQHSHKSFNQTGSRNTYSEGQYSEYMEQCCEYGTPLLRSMYVLTKRHSRPVTSPAPACWHLAMQRLTSKRPSVQDDMPM
jgi:hypothetical protein